MTTGPVFLSANWRNLILLNYSVPDGLLAPYLPPGCEIERYEDSAYLSLVAFQFLDTKVFGAHWPGTRSFSEINLRFYVRQGNQRAVTFIREFVSCRLTATIARHFYNEPYVRAQIKSAFSTERDRMHVRYDLDRGQSGLTVEAETDSETYMPPEASTEHFFKEHELGLGRDPEGRLLRYRVEHPVWNCHRVRGWSANVDWAGLFGLPFAVLEGLQPASVVVAQGSPVKVFQRTEESAAPPSSGSVSPA